MAIRKRRLTIPEILNQLEAFYGKQEPCWPADPYLFLLWWYCGYPASDASCSKGWKELTGRIGTDPDAILAAHPAKLTAALKPGGLLPELRAERIKEVTAESKLNSMGTCALHLPDPSQKSARFLRAFQALLTRVRTGYYCSPESSPWRLCLRIARAYWSAFGTDTRRASVTVNAFAQQLRLEAARAALASKCIVTPTEEDVSGHVVGRTKELAELLSGFQIACSGQGELLDCAVHGSCLTRRRWLPSIAPLTSDHLEMQKSSMEARSEADMPRRILPTGLLTAFDDHV